jgi:transposase
LALHPASQAPWLSSLRAAAEKHEEYSRMERDMLRNDQWKRISNLLPGKPTDPGRSAANNRLFIEAVLWVLRTGSPWRDLPRHFGPWNSVYQRFGRWSRRNVWDRVFTELAKDADFEAVYLDSTIVRAHQHASGAAKKTDLRQLAVRVVDSQPRSTPR